MSKKISLFPPGVAPCSKEGAQIIADHIVAHWRARGYESVSAKIFPLRSEDIKREHGVIWGVKSNMFQGFPRGRPTLRVPDPAIAAANAALVRMR